MRGCVVCGRQAGSLRHWFRETNPIWHKSAFWSEACGLVLFEVLALCWDVEPGGRRDGSLRHWFRETNPIGRKMPEFNYLGLNMVHMAESVLPGWMDDMDEMDDMDWRDRRNPRFRETNPICHKLAFWIVSYDLWSGRCSSLDS